MEIKKFGVIGAGQMGNGIVQVAAASGLEVVMSDIKEAFTEKGMATITKNLSRAVSKGKLDQADMDATLARIKPTVDLKDMADADFVVEAAVEREDLKFKIFQDLDEICPPPRHPLHQHLIHSHWTHCGPDPTPREGDRHALHESGTGNEARRGDPGTGHIR